MSGTPETNRSRAARPWLRLLLGLAMLAVLAALPYLQVGDGTTVPPLALFLGRFHPLLLHVPIVLLILALTLEASRWPVLRRMLPQAPAPVEALVLGIGAVGAFLSVLAGWMLAAGGGYDEHLLGEHFRSGLWAAAGGAAALVLHAIAANRNTPLLRGLLGLVLVCTTAALFVAGHHGASLTHGEGFLTEHAPDSIRRLAGLPVRPDPATAATKPPLERAVYADVVAPILAERCSGCHNAQKDKGGLRLDRLELALKGGDNGPAIKPGDEKASLLLQRVRLPADDKEHMPPKGKPQLEEDDVTLLAWWIQTGASGDKKVCELKPPEAVLAALERRVPEAERQRIEAAKRERAAKLEQQLAAVRQQLPGRLKAVVPGSPELEFTAGVDAAKFTDAHLRTIAGFGRDVVDLDLRRTTVTDAGLAVATNLAGLKRLELQYTGIGDPALSFLRGLTNLEVVGLFGTKVTDAGLVQLAALPKLRRVYAAQTAVTSAGAEKFRKGRPGLDLLLGPELPALPATTNAPMPTAEKPMKKGAKA